MRARFVQSIVSGRATHDRRLARSYWLAYEHEAMHLETFLYMLIQSDRVLPPPGAAIPDFRTLAEKAANLRSKNQWHKIPTSEITVGLDDAENDDGPDRYFGWDVERPSRKASVKAFEAQSRAISNGEYAAFLESTNDGKLPASWTSDGGSEISANTAMPGGKGDGQTPSPAFVAGKSIRTVYGPVPLAYALDWPVMASYDELARYAKWADGRIPTMEETRSLYNFVVQTLAPPEKPGELISAVNG